MALSTQKASASRWTYDVFLSFRGADTRKGIVSYLYHELQHVQGIRTFKDDREIEKGTTISPELFRAIENSHIAVVVLSPNYASSTWCLEELTKILQCMKGEGNVLPIFYNVDPSDVRKQTGSFAEHFSNHGERFTEDIGKVKRWKDALTKVANLSGFDAQTHKSERKLIEDVVKRVCSKVHRTFTLLDSTELVGNKFRREQVDFLLASDADDVRFIRLWGMGGIGKTTIAKLVYDSSSFHFEVSSFLANVREVSKRGNLVDLQRQLLFPILREQITQVWDEQCGTSFIKTCFRNKKVLLILDDVDESRQFEVLVGKRDWFGKGSRIIITTRDASLPVNHDIQLSHRVEGLDNDEALELFSRNAFHKNQPDKGFLELSKCFVNYAQGLPLALKILGCSLYKRDQDDWKSELEKLQKIPKSTIFDALKISYDGLDEMNKRIFLDIAHFHKGKDKEEVIEILETCGLYGRIGVDALIQKSLLTMEKSQFHISYINVEMHDLVQQMALEIVRQESCTGEPGERSRLCHPEDIFQVFINNTGTSQIEGIALRTVGLERVDWNCEAFAKMHKLKFLEFDNVIITSIPRVLPNSLRILKWSWYHSESLPQGFQPNLLTKLEMRHSRLDRLWEGRKDFPNLKFMDLSYSRNLICTIDFSGLPNLVGLELFYCTELVVIHSSFAVLKRLISLNLEGCKSISSLPRKVEMDSLEFFNLYGCTGLKKIPEFSREMKNLSKLFLGCTGIEKLPSSIEHLIGLKLLDVSNCISLLCLPNFMCNLKFLEVLNISGCLQLKKLPENLGKMDSLKEIDLSGTSIKEPVPFLVLLKNLKRLSFRGLAQPERTLGLPSEEFSYDDKSTFDYYLNVFLFSMAALSLVVKPDTRHLVLPSLNGLCSLEELDLSDCNLGQGAIPDDISSLSCLRYLDLSGNGFVSLPSIMKLHKLEEFKLERCKSLQEFPCLPSNSILHVNTGDCTSLKRLSGTLELRRNAEMSNFILRSGNCSGFLDNEGCNGTILPMLTRFLQGFRRFDYEFQIITPGRQIPEWFSRQSLEDSFIVELRPGSHSTLIGIALCAVFEDQENSAALPEFDSFIIECFLGVPSHPYTYSHKIGHLVSDHLWVLFMPINQGCGSQIKILFKTCYGKDGGRTRETCSSVKKCGFRLVFEPDVEELKEKHDEPIHPHCPLGNFDNSEDAQIDGQRDEAGPS